MQSLSRNFRPGARMAAIVIIAIAAMGADTVMADTQVPPSGNYSHVTGVARFEKHHTLTPMFCHFDGCIQSKPYWSLVVQTEEARYEVNKPFLVGQENAPDSLQVAGTVIRPGSRLMVHARVEVVTREYALLSDVQSVEVVMDGQSQVEQGDKDLFDGAPFFGWTCRSVNEPYPVYVDVEQISRGGDYSMRVMGQGDAGDTSLRTIAAFDHVSLFMNDTAIRFAGAAQRLHAELAIDQRSGRLNGLDSVLRMTAQIHSTDFRIPRETKVRLVCDRTR